MFVCLETNGSINGKSLDFIWKKIRNVNFLLLENQNSFNVIRHFATRPTI